MPREDYSALLAWRKWKLKTCQPFMVYPHSPSTPGKQGRIVPLRRLSAAGRPIQGPLRPPGFYIGSMRHPPSPYDQTTNYPTQPPAVVPLAPLFLLLLA